MSDKLQLVVREISETNFEATFLVLISDRFACRFYLV